MKLAPLGLAFAIALWLTWSCVASAAEPVAAYVLLGPDGERMARAVTTDDNCPALSVDNHPVAMRTRAEPGTAPLRPTASKPEFTKPSAFPARVCEATLPAAAKSANIGGVSLPLPPKIIRRIVVIGDTGCRIKGGDVQKCDDPNAYPFATIVAAAAAWKPDIVLHVGDYLYRETPCPSGNAACTGTAWGYGLDAWRADFFEPAAVLLKAAPWVMVRGNHESCDRAGQGWRRFFDTYPLTPKRTCDDPANDNDGDFTTPFAVPLGDGAQIIDWDTGAAGYKVFTPDDPHTAAYAANIQAIAALSKNAPHTILANHHPVLGVAAAADKNGVVHVGPNNLSLREILTKADPKLYPAGVDLLLSGHVHVWEQLSFGGQYPSQIVAGFSGTEEDIVPLPETFPANSDPVAGATPDMFSSWVDGFGFMTMERTGPADWKVEIHDVGGAVINRCTIKGRISKCEIAQIHAK